jgi:hypothetical protein
MPQNSQTEAGPSRIERVFRIVDEDSTEGGHDVQISQPDLLRRQSLILRKLIDDKDTNQEIPLKIENNLGCGATEWVLKHLQGQQPDGATNPKALAIHCAILWKYECIPDSFNEQGESMQPRSSSSSVSNGDQQSSTSTSPSRRSRCWQERKDLEICRQLITIAIVLGWQKILEDEIKTAVWGTFKEMDITILPGVDIDDIEGKLLQQYDRKYQLNFCSYKKKRTREVIQLRAPRDRRHRRRPRRKPSENSEINTRNTEAI